MTFPRKFAAVLPLALWLGLGTSAHGQTAPDTVTTIRPRTAIPQNQGSTVPQVQFSNGNLTIHAHNSTLTDVLAAVRHKTGAQVEAPPSASSERVAVDLGPGPADDVLAELLNGSRYDYVILASARDPRDLSYIMLQEKSGGAATGEAQAQAQQQPQPVPETEEEEPPPPPEEPAQTEPEPPAAEQPDQPAPAQQPDNDGNAQNNNANPDANGNEQQPKTPEQLLEELKQMQQQQQQGNQQQPQPQQQPQQQNQPPQAQQFQPEQPQQQFPPEQYLPQ